MRIAGLLLLTSLIASAASPFAGGAVCGQCHREHAERFWRTGMAEALKPVATCEILQQHPDLKFESGGYRYRITRQGNQSSMTVTGDGKELTVPLSWAFGLGQAGQTYVFERDGVYYESRVSFFESLKGLDLTMGARGTRATNIADAAGRRMSTEEAGQCFGCHSTGGVSQGRLNLESMEPGITCEGCHGPAAKHVAAVKSGDAANAKMRKLSALSTEEMSDLCGKCHRTWSQIAMHGPFGVNNVRFQPYRLANSKCYDVTDSRIRCSACHDPHQKLVLTETSYDSKCSACHSAPAHTKTCPVAKENCASCHMPKVALPGANAKFTDHQIRIVRANEPYPN